MEHALQLKSRYQLSYWDAAIVAAAKALGAGVLYSEDLNHRQLYDGVRVENPFITTPSRAAPARA